MVILIPIVVMLVVALGCYVYCVLILNGESDFYAIFDSVMAVTTLVLVVVWVYIFAEGLGII